MVNGGKMVKETLAYSAEPDKTLLYSMASDVGEHRFPTFQKGCLVNQVILF